MAILFFRKYLTLFFIISFPGLVNAQTYETEKFNNKVYPELLSAPIEEALSYFPELKDVKIDFIFRNKISNAIMQAQPRGKTLFKAREARIYKIKISRNLQFGEKTKPIEEVPHDVLVGWFAHELGHVMDYLHRTSFQMIGFGINYVTSSRFVKQAELEADKYAITKGLASFIILTKEFILNHDHLSDDYKNRIQDLYISPEEVVLIEENISDTQESIELE